MGDCTGDLTNFVQLFRASMAARVSIDEIFQRVLPEAANGLVRLFSQARLKRPLVLVDRGGALPPFVPPQFASVPPHVVAREATVASLRAAFTRGAIRGSTSAGAGAGEGAGAGAGVGGGAVARNSGLVRVVALHGGLGTGKTTAAATYVAATYEHGEYPGGVLWLCGETWEALELSMQQLFCQQVLGQHSTQGSLSEGCDGLLQWLVRGQRGRWLIVVDNASGVEGVLPRLLERLATLPIGGDVLVTTRASGAQVLMGVPSAACVEQGCLRTCDAAVVIWRLVCSYNALHYTHCGWRGCSVGAGSGETDQELPEVPPHVPRELRALWATARSEYAALLELAQDSDFGCCGLPLAVVTGAGALCVRNEAFSAFLAACEKEAGRVVALGDSPDVGMPLLSAAQFLQRHGIGRERAVGLVASLFGGGPVAIGDLSKLSHDSIDRTTARGDEREKLRQAVNTARQLATTADADAASRLATRRRLARIWALCRAGLSPAAQELMDIIAYFPPDCAMEEVLVWGSLPSSSSIARAFAASKSASAPARCECAACDAQLRRQVLASLAATLAAASLVDRWLCPQHVVFPRRWLADDADDAVHATLRAEGPETIACLSVHRAVQDVVRQGHLDHSRSSVRPAVLAWRCCLTCHQVASDEPRDTASCFRHPAPSASVILVMAARHVAEAAAHVGSDGVLATAGAGSRGCVGKLLGMVASALGRGGGARDAIPSHVRVLQRVCNAAGLLARCKELHAALAVCEWVGTGAHRGSGLWHACVRGVLPRTAVYAVACCLQHLRWVYNKCSMHSTAAAMSEESVSMLQRVGGTEGHGSQGAAQQSLETLYSSLGRMDELASQAEALEALRRIHGNKDRLDTASALSRLAQAYQAQGRIAESLVLHEESLAMLRRVDGNKDCTEVAALLDTVAQAYISQGRVGEAAPLLVESLSMWRRIHGNKDHTQVARSTFELGHAFRRLGRLDEAASLLGESLSMMRRVHGSQDHRDVAAVLQHLAKVHQAQGDIDTSICMYKESLAMKRRVHGNKDHAAVARSLRTLAKVFMAQSRWAESASLFEEAIAMSRRVYGHKDHSSVASMLGNLGQVYMVQERLDESAPQLEKSLSMWRRIHGNKDHRDVVVALNKLGECLRVQGEPTPALVEESLAMARRIHGSTDHSLVCATMCQLAQAYQAQGRLDEAASLAREALAMRRRMHGSEGHSSVSSSLYALARVYKAQGRCEESASLLDEALSMLQQIHGSKDHGDVATSLCLLAEVYTAQGRLGASASLHEKSLAMTRRLYSSREPRFVAVSLCRLASVYMEQRRLDEAAVLLEESLTMRRRIYGSNLHLRLLYSLAMLALVYIQQERCDEAILLLEEAIPMLRGACGDKDKGYYAALFGSADLFHAAQSLLSVLVALHGEVLATSRRNHGEKDHSEVARALSKLAGVLKLQGRLHESASLEQEALAMRHRIDSRQGDASVA